LDAIEAAAAIEAWWWTGEAGAEFAVRDWLDRAARQADDLARNADDLAGKLRQAAAARLDGWHGSLS
jgi:hypothetical protein